MHVDIGMYCIFDVYLILYICIFFSLQNSEAIANMDDDFILLQIYDETQDEVRDKDLEVRKIEAKVQKIFIILFIQCITDVIFTLISV